MDVRTYLYLLKKSLKSLTAEAISFELLLLPSLSPSPDGAKAWEEGLLLT